MLIRLRALLNENEWRDLPVLMAERRAGRLRELQAEREQRERLAAQRQLDAENAIRRKIEDLEQLNREKLKQEELERKRVELWKEIRRRLQHDFLSLSDYYRDCCEGFITKREFEEKIHSFVREWVITNMGNKANGSVVAPDDEQIAAIASLGGHVQVVARAGSGKTSTLVSRALFLIKHCHVSPSELLVLAFNRKAALEIRARLLRLLNNEADALLSAEIARRSRGANPSGASNGDDIQASVVDSVSSQLDVALPYVMTFHALAYAIVHPQEDLLYDAPEDGAQQLSRVVQQVVDDNLQIPETRERIRALMMAHFREDWERIVAGGYHRDRDEFLRFRRFLPRVSIDGKHVKSHGEKVIADFLCEHDIPYLYEYSHDWNGVNYRPDFTLFRGSDRGVVIEYFGMLDDPNYRQTVRKKRAYWASRRNWMLLEFAPRDLAGNDSESFRRLLKTRLERQGISCVPLSEDELWLKVRERAIDSFTKALMNFIGRCRQQCLSPSGLEQLVEAHSPISSVEESFLKLAIEIYAGYMERLSASGEDDFNGLLQRAARAIEQGQTVFRRKSESGNLEALSHICIDEFQDFSELFHRLVGAIRSRNANVELFCVGDDWQAINGFAGSDLRFFECFTEYFGEARQLYLSTNYRSCGKIVSIGNDLMHGLGQPARAYKSSAGEVLVASLESFEPSVIEREQYRRDVVTPMVSRLASHALRNHMDVALLCRTNNLPWYTVSRDQDNGRVSELERFTEAIRSSFAEDLGKHIDGSTVHKYKGLERTMVIVLDAVDRRFPLIHPDWVFSRVLGQSLERIVNEERRLLYVALTRAVATLVIITDGSEKSPFLEELERRHPMSKIDWSRFPACPSNQSVSW